MKKLLFVVLALALLVPFAVQAQEEFAAWEELIPYIQSLEDRIAELEAKLTPGAGQASVDVPAPAPTTPDSKVGNYDLKVNRFELNKNRDGKDVVTFYFQFTNLSTETANFWDIDKEAFQNGIEIDDVIESPLYSNWDVDLRPNASIEVSFSFLLLDTENPVELELEESFDWDAEPVLYVFDLAEASKE